jgi:hypothetical protein
LAKKKAKPLQTHVETAFAVFQWLEQCTEHSLSMRG